MKPSEARQRNRATTNRLVRSIKTVSESIISDGLPGGLVNIGEDAAEHAKATHAYENRTGALERSTDFAVVAPHSVGQFEYETPDGGESVDVTNERGEWLLVIGAGMHYAKYVELSNGYDVVIQSVIKTRNELAKKLAGHLRSFRIKK